MECRLVRGRAAVVVAAVAIALSVVVVVVVAEDDNGRRPPGRPVAELPRLSPYPSGRYRQPLPPKPDGDDDERPDRQAKHQQREQRRPNAPQRPSAPQKPGQPKQRDPSGPTACDETSARKETLYRSADRLETTTQDRAIIIAPLNTCPDDQRMSPDRRCEPIPIYTDPESDDYDHRAPKRPSSA